ncbi:DUF4331 family protein [Phycisphaera mikurensis]|uniref:DUF4331 domain-containing protein n=1 Tax=Phycisphaera mikurensis (strain NBRC 102666 / KCTC 22515 / FYK2301M01) TaxID=1142394 RepID=I0IF88_PHYMF|nr:DUF4331 family protein [Phycisphaera mikurensis]MBB6440678.1 MYXO-CTERM domain-containing protein [Phycisphaera mikurensis]BAM03926.1 hypothetical protein PSMK_17670 [Phycisphaera mikurensis NBRC 102666]
MQNRPRLLLAAAVLPAGAALAADHLDAPSVAANGQADINDLYAFQSPTNADNTVLILTVNPAAGVLSPTTFGDDVRYDILIDSDGDALADASYSTSFFTREDGRQDFTVTRGGEAYASGTTGARSTSVSGGQVTAGLFEDPFFFDLDGFNDGFAFTGDDFFAGLDVSAIVLEVPSAELGAVQVGLYAETRVDGERFDLMGRPAINTVLLEGDRKELFNDVDPADQFSVFGEEVTAKIASLSDQENAESLTPILLPDLLTYDSSSDAGYLNGRRLDDDVIDASLSLLTAGALVSDGVDGNDRAFLNAFPFLAAANGDGPVPIPTPSAAAAGLALLGVGVARRRRRVEA